MKRKINRQADELFFAVNTNDFNSVKKLAAKGVDVNARDEGGSTPLMRAAVNGNTDVAKLLLDHGADVNVQDRHGWSALHFAAQKYDEV